MNTCGQCEFYDLDCRGGAESLDPACPLYKKYVPETPDYPLADDPVLTAHRGGEYDSFDESSLPEE